MMSDQDNLRKMHLLQSGAVGGEGHSQGQFGEYFVCVSQSGAVWGGVSQTGVV